MTHNLPYAQGWKAPQTPSLDTKPIASANLDFVRSICAPWERGHFRAVEWAHPEIEYVEVGGPAPGRWTGVTGMEKAHRDFLSAWDEFRLEAEDYRELDPERVIVLFRRSGRGKTSGVALGELRSAGASLFHVRDGKVIRLVFYADREHALADLGLTP